MNETSLSLLARISQSADSDSWDRLVELYTPLMRRWVRSYEVTGADADDLVQEVLTVVSQELPKFKHNERAGAFRSWLRKILVNRLRNHWRDRQNSPPVPTENSVHVCRQGLTSFENWVSPDYHRRFARLARKREWAF